MRYWWKVDDGTGTYLPYEGLEDAARAWLAVLREKKGIAGARLLRWDLDALGTPPDAWSDRPGWEEAD